MKNSVSLLVDPPVATKHRYPRLHHDGAWSPKDILQMPLEERGKVTQEAWQEMEVTMRRLLRTAVRRHGADKKTKELKDLAVAAQICHIRAYPGQEQVGMNLHAPAHLLRAVSERILRSAPQPVDITPLASDNESIPLDVKIEKSSGWVEHV